MTDTALRPASVAHLQPLLERLTLEQKAALVQGADFWTTVPVPEIGLRAMTLSDGPAGVRGPRWDEREPSLNLPSGSALAAAWDVDLAYRYGAAAASEARRKGVDVVLGPTINLHRSPLGGRHFECFSEDPELSAELAAAYVRGLQDNGVAATPSTTWRTTPRPTASRSTSASASARCASSTSPRSSRSCRTAACGPSWPRTTASAAGRWPRARCCARCWGASGASTAS